MSKKNKRQLFKRRGDRLAALSREIGKISKEIPISCVVAIIATAEVINEYLRRDWRRSGSTQAGFRILNTLTRNGGSMRFTDLSKKVFRSKCAVTRAVDNLEKAGLVKRKPMDEDRREKRVAITEKGVEFIDQTMHQRRLISSEIMSGLNEKKMNELISLLRHVRRHVRSLFRESDEPYPKSNHKRRSS